MTLKCDPKFEEKLTCSLENGVRNLTNFHFTRSLKTLKIGTLIGFFYQK